MPKSISTDPKWAAQADEATARRVSKNIPYLKDCDYPCVSTGQFDAGCRCMDEFKKKSNNEWCGKCGDGGCACDTEQGYDSK